MRSTLSLPESLKLQPPLRQLINNYCAQGAFQQGQPVTVVRGTKIREVTEPRLLEERRVLEDADLSRPGQVEKALQNLNQRLKNEARSKQAKRPKKDRANLTSEYAQQIAGLAAALRSNDAVLHAEVLQGLSQPTVP